MFINTQLKYQQHMSALDWLDLEVKPNEGKHQTF